MVNIGHNCRMCACLCSKSTTQLAVISRATILDAQPPATHSAKSSFLWPFLSSKTHRDFSKKEGSAQETEMMILAWQCSAVPVTTFSRPRRNIFFGLVQTQQKQESGGEWNIHQVLATWTGKNCSRRRTRYKLHSSYGHDDLSISCASFGLKP